jgi:two-component system KDP operon response regulator KdpE
MDNTKTKKKRVLVVDDERDILNFIRVKLTSVGYEVLTTTNGQEALEWLQKEKFDIVLLDILMETVSGFEVLDKLRTFSQVPVIVFTRQSFIADLALKMGASDYIAKPFDPEELVRKIKGILDHRETGHPASGL